MKTMTTGTLAVYTDSAIYCGKDDVEFTRVVRDSREASEGCLFVGLKGETNDGNDYAEKAYENGCKAFLLSEESAARSLNLHGDASVVLVDDTLAAMQQTARYYLEDSGIIKIGVTGSTGKTSTKEMLKCVFSSKYRTICNTGNFNNHIGVPLTAFTVEEDTEAGIFEMGMNHRGEISLLADIVKPDTACITNIGISHIGNLGSRENILAAKLEITENMGGANTLVYNCDNDLLSGLDTADTKYKKIRAGQSADASGIVISDVADHGEDGIDFKLTHEGETVDFHIPLPGAHNAWNASLAAGAGLVYGISLKDSANALKNLEITGNRLKIEEAGGIKVINDTYNASPDSVKAAIDVLAAAGCGRRVAVLADMFELGENSAEFHEEVGRYAADRNIDLVITVGENARYIAKGALTGLPEDRVISFEDKDSFTTAAPDLLKSGDGVLVKGSHGMHMDEAADFILKMER